MESLPHARGGVSVPAGPSIAVRMSSPRPWGCFQRHIRFKGDIVVFPTPVGVFPAVR